jgi:hypothetical protein
MPWQVSAICRLKSSASERSGSAPYHRETFKTEEGEKMRGSQLSLQHAQLRHGCSPALVDPSSGLVWSPLSSMPMMTADFSDFDLAHSPSGFCGRLRQGGNNVGVLRSMDMPRAVLFAANEEENPLARLADAAVGLDLADQFP